MNTPVVHSSRLLSTIDDSGDQRILADPRARPLTPRPHGVRYGSSFLREREISAGDARQQARIAAHERAAGVR